jgi:hypothetical protein
LIDPAETLTLTAEFCDAPAPVFMLSDCSPARFWNAPSPVVRLLSTAPLAPPGVRVDYNQTPVT